MKINWRKKVHLIRFMQAGFFIFCSDFGVANWVEQLKFRCQTKQKKTCKQRWLCTFVPPLSRYLVSYAYYDIQITSEVEMLEAVSKTKSRSSNSNPKQPISHAARAKPVALYWKLSRESRLSNIYQIYCALQKCWKKCNFFGEPILFFYDFKHFDFSGNLNIIGCMRYMIAW